MSPTVAGHTSIDARIVRYINELFGEGMVSLVSYSIEAVLDTAHVLRVSIELQKIAPINAIQKLGNASEIAWSASGLLYADLSVNIYDLLGIEKELSS